MKLSSLLFVGEYTSFFRPDDIEVLSICYSSEDIRPGSLFVCIRGTRYDSHLLLQHAIQNGAVAALVEENADYTAPESFPIFIVPSTRRALSFIYDRFCSHPSQSGLRLIAVTGTNGKTSTATMIYSILEATGHRVAMIGTVACKSHDKNYSPIGETRNTMTTPDPDILYPMLKQMKDDNIEFVVMETSSHALALEKLSPLHFDVGVFTNLSPEHLDFHGNMENYANTKGKLFSQCSHGILNFDNEYAEKIAKNATCHIVRCGAVYHEQYNAEDIRQNGAQGVSYTYATPQEKIPLSVPIPGIFTVYNSLLAITCTTQLGIPPNKAAEALANIVGVPGRLERISLPSPQIDFSVFIDYAHTEAALQNLLNTVCGFRRGGERIVLLFGCGGDRDASKRAPMGMIAEKYADYIIVTSDNSRTEEPVSIIHDILLGMKNKSKRTVIVNRRRAIEHAILHAQKDDIILLVSKGHETYELVGNKMHAFDEKKIVYEALEKRRICKEKNENCTGAPLYQ